MILSQVLSLYECSSAFQTSLLPVSLTVPHNHLRRCQNFFCDDQASSSLQVISLSFPFLTSLIRPHFIKMYITWRGSGCSVGIATGYGLDGPGIESLWGEIFHTPFQNGPWAHPASYTIGTESFPGIKRPGRDVYHPRPSSAQVKEREELYLYSPSGHPRPLQG